MIVVFDWLYFNNKNWFFFHLVILTKLVLLKKLFYILLIKVYFKLILFKILFSVLFIYCLTPGPFSQHLHRQHPRLLQERDVQSQFVFLRRQAQNNRAAGLIWLVRRQIRRFFVQFYYFWVDSETMIRVISLPVYHKHSQTLPLIGMSITLYPGNFHTFLFTFRSPLFYSNKGWSLDV